MADDRRTLFLTNVPVEIVEALDARVAAMRGGAPALRRISRTAVAIDALAGALGLTTGLGPTVASPSAKEATSSRPFPLAGATPFPSHGRSAHGQV